MTKELRSEELFRDFLVRCALAFETNYPLEDKANPKNVDFCIQSSRGIVLADVKEIRDSPKRVSAEFVAHEQLKKDIQRLRAKFPAAQPAHPVVLVSMNFSSCLFTGLTVRRAMLGELAVLYSVELGEWTTDVHHSPTGNAALNAKKNRSISAVLVFDPLTGIHVLFNNPYALHPVPLDYFPDTRVLFPKKNDTESTIEKYGRLMFWGQIDEDGPAIDRLSTYPPQGEPTKPTVIQIQNEIEELGGVRSLVARMPLSWHMSGNDLCDMVDAQIAVLQAELDRDNICDLWPDNEDVDIRDAALRARTWLDGDKHGKSPATDWRRYIRDSLPDATKAILRPPFEEL